MQFYSAPGMYEFHDAPAIDECFLQSGCSSDEALDLGASEIACAVADALTVWCLDGNDRTWHWPTDMPPSVRETLTHLEAATRGSALRKVRP